MYFFILKKKKKKKKNSIRINTIWDFLLVSLLRENLKSGGLHF